MKRILWAVVGVYLNGCMSSSAPPPQPAPTARPLLASTPSPTPAGMADYSFDLSVWGGHSIRYEPARRTLQITSFQHLSRREAGFALSAVQAEKLETVLRAHLEVIQRLGQGALGGPPLVGMEHESMRYVASTQHPELKEVEAALKPYLPLSEGVGPEGCWMVGKLQGVKRKHLTVLCQTRSYPLAGSTYGLKCREGMNVLAVGQLEGDRYRLTQLHEWKGSMAPYVVPPQFPEQEGDPPQLSEFVHDPSGVITSRVRISLILKDRAQPSDLPGILRCADPQARLARCWPELKIMTFVIPDSPDLKKVEAAVKRLSHHKLVESATLFMDMPMGPSVHQPKVTLDEPARPESLSREPVSSRVLIRHHIGR